MGSSEGFYLGGVIDPETGKRTEEQVRYEPGDLTTHGVIVGMTGSGKTGLGIIFLEEALRVRPPRPDPGPQGGHDQPPPHLPRPRPRRLPPLDRRGRRPAGREDARRGRRRRGRILVLRAGGLGPRHAPTSPPCRAAADFTIYTPGSEAGSAAQRARLPLRPARPGPTPRPTATRSRASSPASSGWPASRPTPWPAGSTSSSPTWSRTPGPRGADLTLEALIELVHRPPLRKLGVFELETFFPEKDRLALALRLNNLVASPSFAAWRSGPPLDIPSMLWTPEGKPRAAILYLAHLSDAERQFAVTLALSRLVTWMRSQPGSSELRALVYMDEVFGFVPPTAVPPAKKPILTILKQARAFGVGMLLSTQNPVDLDYKAMSNAGTWCIGRLQTERDKARIMEALQSAAGDRDLAGLDALISGPGQAPVPAAQHPRPRAGDLHHPLGDVLPAGARSPGDEVACHSPDDPLRAAGAAAGRRAAPRRRAAGGRAPGGRRPAGGRRDRRVLPRPRRPLGRAGGSRAGRHRPGRSAGRPGPPHLRRHRRRAAPGRGVGGRLPPARGAVRPGRSHRRGLRPARLPPRGPGRGVLPAPGGAAARQGVLHRRRPRPEGAPGPGAHHGGAPQPGP